MPSRESFAYRRAARLRAQQATSDVVDAQDTIYSKAAADFHTFCTVLDKAPARHMLEWHEHLITGESNKYLLDIAGENLDIAWVGQVDRAQPVHSLDYRQTHHGAKAAPDHLLLVQHCDGHPEEPDYSPDH